MRPSLSRTVLRFSFHPSLRHRHRYDHGAGVLFKVQFLATTRTPFPSESVESLFTHRRCCCSHRSTSISDLLDKAFVSPNSDSMIIKAGVIERANLAPSNVASLQGCEVVSIAIQRTKKHQEKHLTMLSKATKTIVCISVSI